MIRFILGDNNPEKLIQAVTVRSESLKNGRVVEGTDGIFYGPHDNLSLGSIATV